MSSRLKKIQGGRGGGKTEALNAKLSQAFQAAQKAKAKQPKPPPLDQIPIANAGPAGRTLRVIHGKDLIQNLEESGVFWDCPKCSKRRDMYNQQAHNKLATGGEITVLCDCGGWARLQKQSIIVAPAGAALPRVVS